METRNITAKVNEPFEIELNAHALGGGYMWELEFLEFDFKLVTTDFKSLFPSYHPFLMPDVGGGAGIQIFVLEPFYPGGFRIKAKHKRPWLNESLEEIEFLVKVHA